MHRQFNIPEGAGAIPGGTGAIERLVGEARFDLPPRLAGAERRLATRAALAFAGGEGCHPFRDNAVTLEREAGGGATVRAVGHSVCAACCCRRSAGARQC